MGRASSNPKIRSSNLTFSSANFTGSFRKEYAIIMKKKLTAYLTRWSGPVLESVDPYEPFHNTSPPGLSAKKHIQQVILISGETICPGKSRRIGFRLGSQTGSKVKE